MNPVSQDSYLYLYLYFYIYELCMFISKSYQQQLCCWEGNGKVGKVGKVEPNAALHTKLLYVLWGILPVNLTKVSVLHR